LAGFFDRIFGGRSRALAQARSAELRGDMPRAASLFERAGRPDEAARVRRARALSVVAGALAVPMTVSRRPEVLEAAAQLESLGELVRAAEAYRWAHDVEGEARALARAGEVERLDDLLEAEQTRDRSQRAARAAHEEFDLLVASGRRRSAVALARACTDPSLRARGATVQARRLAGSLVKLQVRGRPMTLVLGERLVVGRALEPEAGEGAIAVGASSVSRRHLGIARRGDEVLVCDLGTHNGTRLRGAALQGDVPVGDGIELRLGGEVPLVVRPAEDLPGAIAVEVAGRRYLARLGPAALPIGEWRIERAGDAGDGLGEWLELATGDAPPAFAGGLRLAPRVSLLAGDAFAAAPGGEPVLRFALEGPT
jgi:hypothetical protein